MNKGHEKWRKGINTKERNGKYGLETKLRRNKVSLCYWGMMKVTQWTEKDLLAQSGSTDMGSTCAA
jgi:hypothetical protein